MVLRCQPYVTMQPPIRFSQREQEQLRDYPTVSISNYINSAAHRNGDMTVSFKTTTPGNYELYNVKSWEVDRRSILGLMGVIDSNPSNANISGVRLHLAETKESESYDFFGKTLVITPLDRNGREIIPPNPNDTMGIEYHRPCPKYC